MGRKKKKSAAAMPAIDARVAGQMPHRVAATMTGIRYAIGTRLAAKGRSNESRTAVTRPTHTKDISRGKTSVCKTRYEGCSSSNREVAPFLIPIGPVYAFAGL